MASLPTDTNHVTEPHLLALEARMDRLEVYLDGFNRRLDHCHLALLVALLATVAVLIADVFMV